MNKIQIFDVDGTLTYHEKDLSLNNILHNKYKTFAYWQLITERFCINKTCLFDEIKAWEKTMITEPNKEKSSRAFLQKIIKSELIDNVTTKQIEHYATCITDDFIEQGIVRVEAIEYLNDCLNNNVICILTTGSYLDGLHGFLKSLVKHRLIDSTKNLVLHGAEIDWRTRNVIRANVGQYKTNKCRSFLSTLKKPYVIQAVFGDDPEINDRQLLAFVPDENAFVIKSCKTNKNPSCWPYVYCTWTEYLTHYSKRVLAQ